MAALESSQPRGIEVCYGGVGIHGHVAFNEPEAGAAHTGPRLQAGGSHPIDRR